MTKKCYLIEYDVVLKNGLTCPAIETPLFETEEELNNYIIILKERQRINIKWKENV